MFIKKFITTFYRTAFQYVVTRPLIKGNWQNTTNQKGEAPTGACSEQRSGLEVGKRELND